MYNVHHFQTFQTFQTFLCAMLSNKTNIISSIGAKKPTWAKVASLMTNGYQGVSFIDAKKPTWAKVASLMTNGYQGDYDCVTIPGIYDQPLVIDHEEEDIYNNLPSNGNWVKSLGEISNTFLDAVTGEMNDELRTAYRSREYDAVETLIVCGANPFVTLIVDDAMCNDDADLIIFIVKNAKQKLPYNLFHLAVKNCKPNIVEKLFFSGHSIGSKIWPGWMCDLGCESCGHSDCGCNSNCVKMSPLKYAEFCRSDKYAPHHSIRRQELSNIKECGRLLKAYTLGTNILVVGYSHRSLPSEHLKMLHEFLD
jgi:hypothetical protein